MASTFERVESRLIHSGHIVQFYVESFVGPDGERFDRDVIRHPGAASVVPLHDDGTVTLVRQFRAALGEELLEIPAGKIDVAGESPELTVHRELAEEVGLVASQLVLLSSFVQSPGFCDEVNHVFLATGLSETQRSVQGIEEEHMTIHRVALLDVPELIASGELVDGKSIVGLMIAFHQLVQ